MQKADVTKSSSKEHYVFETKNKECPAEAIKSRGFAISHARNMFIKWRALKQVVCQTLVQEGK